MSAAPLQAQARLELSRSRLRLALQQLHAEQADTKAAQAPHPGWWQALRSEPGTRVLLDTLSAWWAQQPWQQSASLLFASTNQLLRPLARRRPLTLVLGAAAVGAALLLLKPWRWISVPALAAGLLPQLAAKLINQLRPLSWSHVLRSWLHTPDHPKPEDAAPSVG
jgi:hypothetical protein